ncbi:MAG TPA: bifunctional transaldolase/phosoglucose isomerase [Solirubrobacteraceae bacterium]|nr:bifunctional transaldolase/phosoglucose isomerase [Solirubrobacteraceae bacterium]
MSQAVNSNPRLSALVARGTSPWLDQIRRSLTQGGELRRMVEEDSLRGVTSNPAIFEKAILGSPDYDEQIEELSRGGALARAIYQEIAIQDVQEAADILRSVFDDLGGDDGYVSLEVDPDLAFDSDRTIAQAREYWARVDRPNVMIKIPGTPECLPAIEQAIYEGINVNVTLLFSVEAYTTVCESYIKGLERRHAEGKDLDVRSVASFFVSRVDSEVDKRLEEIGRTDLQGQAAVANARAAYRRFEEIFGGGTGGEAGGRFAELLAAGAHVQRPLWASTGVKNPAYSETKYVEELVGPDTVNTMPMQTLLACAERLEVTGETVREDPTPVLEALAAAGIDMDDVTDKQLRAGLDAFVTPMEKLLAGIEAKREAIFTGRPETIDSSLPDELEPMIAGLVQRAETERVARRIWSKDDTLWGEHGQAEVADRLGWLNAHETYAEQIDDLEAFAKEAADAGYTDTVLLGMGGSSLAPEVLRRSFGSVQHDRLRLHVLDSTDPAAVLAQERAVDLEHTLFVVSTKSGGTLETISLFEHFWALRPHGEQFVAITDPGSSLQALASERGFRRTFCNDADVGGRYSALTYFGLVPAALMGVDLDALLEGAGVAAEACAVGSTSEGNSGLWLGISMGALALQGRDKLTFVVDRPIASFGLWVEQLVAESLGKQGRGVVPVTDEPVGSPDVYGEDRVFCYLRGMDEPDETLDEQVRALAAANQPTVTLSAGGPGDLGRIFFFAEFATAVAGWVLAINPFDQPDVQVAKDTTGKILAGIEASGALEEPEDADDDALRALIGDAGPGDYVALLGFMAPSEEVDAAVHELRSVIRDSTRATTTFGYGPRYLHSTGQLHKGGPANGRFLVLVHDGDEDVDVPGKPFSFQVLKNAQALGDLETLRSRGRKAEKLRLEGSDAAAGVSALTARVRELLGAG